MIILFLSESDEGRKNFRLILSAVVGDVVKKGNEYAWN